MSRRDASRDSAVEVEPTEKKEKWEGRRAPVRSGPDAYEDGRGVSSEETHCRAEHVLDVRLVGVRRPAAVTLDVRFGHAGQGPCRRAAASQGVARVAPLVAV